MRQQSKKIILARLNAWEVERVSNAYGMQDLADREIAILRDYIAARWPVFEALNDQPKNE